MKTDIKNLAVKLEQLDQLIKYSVIFLSINNYHINYLLLIIIYIINCLDKAVIEIKAVLIKNINVLIYVKHLFTDYFQQSYSASSH